MLIRIDPSSAVPLYEQFAASVRGAIADGSVAAGQRLPSARDLASSLNINVHTVLRGYQELRDEGLIELRRGRGAVVVGDAPARGRVLAAVREAAAEARRYGMNTADLIDLVKKEMT